MLISGAVQADVRLGAAFEQARVDHGENGADHPFGRHAGRLAPDGGGGAALVDHLAQLLEDAGALLEHARSTAKGIHDA